MAKWTPRLVPILLTGCALLALPSPASAIPSREARTLSFRLQTEGMRLYKEGKYEDATEAFRQVVNINLNSFLAYYYLGASLVASRRYGEAIEPLKYALDLQPDYIQAHVVLGDAYLKQGDSSEARAEYLRALDLQPNYAPAYDGLGRLFESIGNETAAEEQYRKALQINVAFADVYTHLGDLYLRQDRLDDAIELFLKAISVKLDFSSAYTRLSVAYARQNRFDDAIAAARKSQELAPSDPEPYVALAGIYLDLQSYRRAEAEILSALAQDHDHPGAHLVLSDLKRSQEEFESAREVLEDLYERGIEDAQMRRAVGAALEKARADAARHALLHERASSEPADPEAMLELARFLSARGAHHRAAVLIERTITLLSPAEVMTVELPPPDDGSVADDTESILPDAGLGTKNDDAALRNALRFELGLEYLEGRLYTRALMLFREMAEPGPPTPSSSELRSRALFNVGVACAGLGLDRRAVAVFSTYLSDHPDDPEAHLYLGNAYFRLGRRDDARGAWSVYLEKAVSTPLARRVRELIEDLGVPPAPVGALEGGETTAATHDGEETS